LGEGYGVQKWGILDFCCAFSGVNSGKFVLFFQYKDLCPKQIFIRHEPVQESALMQQHLQAWKHSGLSQQVYFDTTGVSKIPFFLLINDFVCCEPVLFNRRVSQSTTQSFTEKDTSAQLCGYLCVPLRLRELVQESLAESKTARFTSAFDIQYFPQKSRNIPPCILFLKNSKPFTQHPVPLSLRFKRYIYECFRFTAPRPAPRMADTGRGRLSF
jgi:hypothetical protein